MTGKLSKPVSDGSVVFADRDYVGLFRRFVNIVVDATILFLAMVVLSVAWAIALELTEEQDPPLEMWLTWLAFAYVYMVILKRSRLRTIGFWITGARIVDHSGLPPSIFRMTFRFLLLILGPVHPIIDLFWLGGDRHRQTLRDKFAGTYVVNRAATPTGPGVRRSAYYSFMGATFIFTEIHPDEELSAILPSIASD